MTKKSILIVGIVVITVGIILNLSSTVMVKTPELECAADGQPTSGFVSKSKNCATTIDSFNKQSEARAAQNTVKRTGVIIALVGLVLVIGSLIFGAVTKRRKV